MMIVRAARREDLPALVELARLSGPGFTSLPDDEATLSDTLSISVESFAAHVTAPGFERYFMMLEEVETGALLGCAGIKATVGIDKPFFNFRRFQITQASASAQRRFDLDVLILVNEYRGATEVGSLFLKKEGRGNGTGRLLARARYLLIAAARERFARRVIAELRGIVDDEGHAPFWEHVIRPFFDMPFEDADALCSSTDKQFILDLMPKYPIYVNLLHQEAQAVIGQTHPEGHGAMALLSKEGFVFESHVDIFDGGPLVSAHRDMITTVRASERFAVTIGHGGERDVLMSTDRLADFRVTRASVGIAAGTVSVSPESAEALGLKCGDVVRLCDF
jgi:arginine N-succinyltransferase